MKVGALSFLKWQRCNSGGRSSTYLIAAWHWKWSVTWSWILSYTHENRNNKLKRFGFFRVHRQRGLYFHMHWRLPFTGLFSLQTQPTMKR